MVYFDDLCHVKCESWIFLFFYHDILHHTQSTMDYSYIIRDEMESEGIMTSEIPERTASQGVRGFAEIKCCSPTCSWSWSSHRAHVVIDLKRQRVTRIYKQKCKKCERENEPTFRDLVFRGLVLKAIEQEKKFRNPVLGDVDIDDGNDGGRRGPPHESRLCEKCQYGRTQCWTKK